MWWDVGVGGELLLARHRAIHKAPASIRPFRVARSDSVCRLIGVVSIAALVSALPCADSILVTSTVRDLVVGSGFAFEPRGSRILKGVPGRWRLYEVVDRASVEDARPSDAFGRRLSVNDRGG
jgi:hypothetical protein